MLKVKEGKSCLRGFFFLQIKEKKKMHVFRINYLSQLLRSHASESEQRQAQVKCNWEAKLFWKVLPILQRQGKKYF